MPVFWNRILQFKRDVPHLTLYGPFQTKPDTEWYIFRQAEIFRKQQFSQMLREEHKEGTSF